MMRGQSFENEQGCDEIILQFLNGLDSFVEPYQISCDIEENDEKHKILQWTFIY